MFQKNQLLVAVMAVLSLAASAPLFAASATWTGGGTDNLWANNDNWDAAYPNGDGENARFNTTSDLTVDVDTAITLADLTHRTSDGAGNSAGTITLGGTGSLTFRDTSDNQAGIYSQQSSMVSIDNFVGPFDISLPITLDVDVFDIGSSVNPNAALPQITAATGRDVVVNSSLRTGWTRTFTGVNDFGVGTLNFIGLGRHILSGADSAGGADTTINLDNTRLDINASAANGNFGNDINILHSGQTSLFFSGGSGATDPVTVGSIELGDARTLQLITTSNGSRLHINAGETVHVGAGSVLLVDNFSNIRKGDLYFTDGASLIGVGALVTHPASDGDPIPFAYFQSGATLNPGESTANSTSVFNIGNATYFETMVTLQPGAIAHFDLNGPTPGLEYDQLNIFGTFVIDQSILEVNLGYEPSPSDRIFLTELDAGDIVGTFADLPDGSLVNLGLYDNMPATARISYFGDQNTNSITGGNDIVLYAFHIPEPSVMSMLALGCIALVRHRRQA